ncbi:MAG: hypothetical protein AAFW95_06980, partial [Cyanobacteria bacterium J06638_6]
IPETSMKFTLEGHRYLILSVHAEYFYSNFSTFSVTKINGNLDEIRDTFASGQGWYFTADGIAFFPYQRLLNGWQRILDLIVSTMICSESARR